MPVVSTEVSAIDFAVYPSAVNNHGENNETDDGCDFDNAESEFDC